MVITRKNKHNTTRKWFDYKVYDLKSACEWLESVAGIPGLTVNYVRVDDLMNRQDEGNTSTTLSGNEIGNVYQRALNAEVDVLSLNGNYKGIPVVIGANCRDQYLYLTTRNAFEKTHTIEIDELCQILKIGKEITKEQFYECVKTEGLNKYNIKISHQISNAANVIGCANADGWLVYETDERGQCCMIAECSSEVEGLETLLNELRYRKKKEDLVEKLKQSKLTN